MVLMSAIRRIFGACWFALIVCPSRVADGNDFAGHGRRDFRIPQIGFGGVYRRRSLLHLRRERRDVGGSNIEVRLCDVTVAGGD